MNTTKKNVTKGNNTTTTNTTAKVNTTASTTKNTTTNKVDFPKLSEMEISAVLQGLISANGGYLTISMLKKQESTLTEKYGKSNWISIRAQYHAVLKHKVELYADSVLASIKDYNNALIDAWNRISDNKDFAQLAEYIGISASELKKAWKNAHHFVANTYPALIDNIPARKVSFVTKGSGYIVDAMQVCNLDASKVPAILSACIKNIRTTAYNSLKKGDFQLVKHTHYNAGDIVGIFFAKDDIDKVLIKGDAVQKGEMYDTIKNAGIKGLATLSEYRKECTK